MSIKKGNTILPYPPRRHEHTDIVDSDRLQGFSDAVFATAATLLIVPVRKFHRESKEQHSGKLRDALLDRWQQFLVFIFGYLVICTVWESQIIRFKILKKVDDVVVVLTLLSLMMTTFLPFTIELEGMFAAKRFPIVLNAVFLVAIELLELLMLVYGFHTPALLTLDFIELPPEEKSARKKQIYIKISVNCLLFILAAALSELSFIASGILVCLVIVTPLLRRLMVQITESQCCFGNQIKTNFQMLTGRIDKERIEMFSDAAMAIVATLLILDLTTEDFPSKKIVNENGLSATLSGMWQDFVAYMGTFVTVGMLWFVHHSVIQKIEVFTPVMVLLNNLFLAFTAFSPFISTLVNHYTGHVSHDGEVAVRVSSITIMTASLMIFFILLCAILQEDVTFYDWAVSESHRAGNHSRLYLLLKSLIIPTTAFIVLLCSVFHSTIYASFIAYHFSLFCVPFLFVLLKVIFACHCLRETEAIEDYRGVTYESLDAVYDAGLNSMVVETSDISYDEDQR